MPRAIGSTRDGGVAKLCSVPHRKSVPPDVTGALHTILLYLVNAVREVANDTAACDDSASFYDARTSPTGPTTFRRAAAKGAFPTFKVGRKIMARKVDVDAWIATQARTPKPIAAPAEDDATEFCRALLLPSLPVRAYPPDLDPYF